MPTCITCGGTVIEYDAAAGNGFCVACGTVIEENTIVNEVVFGETSNGAAMVQGSFVAMGSTHARMGGPFGNRGNSESREQTIANANKKIQSIANILRLSESVCLAATRLYTLAVEHKFTKGRKSMNVVAVCLYVACRQKETRNYMLIDFSDLLQVNVFELGHTYLQLVQTLNLRLPLVDPSHYISRFSALLEFGDETHKVATDAVRLVQRFDRDWMTRGRRPAGICGAALLLAARMNNFRRSVEEIVQVVKIADTTLKKRLEEFKNTPSGELTVGDFRSVWLEAEVDPPAFTKGREKEEEERLAREGGEEVAKKLKKKKRKGKRKREDSDDEEQETLETELNLDTTSTPAPAIDPALLNAGILAGTSTEPPPLFLPEPEDYPATSDSTLVASSSMPIEDTVSTAVAQEVSTFLYTTQGTKLSEALDEAEQRRLAEIEVGDELTGLDEEELDRFLLTDEEVKIKERVWVEINRDYLEALAAKGDQSSERVPKSRKRRKVKPRDSESAHGATTAESVRNLIKKNPKYSKRINYDALKDLFVNADGMPNMDEKDEAQLYTLDDKGEDMDMGAPLVIIENDSKPLPLIHEEEKDDDKDDDEDDEEQPMSWLDAYEQEV
ncbi:BRF1-domain-containing protein [Hymenopellis radicata]|nr:BRF1-domain-containing protein [Hymenopellis radicata]